MQDYSDLYIEQGEMAADISGIEWVDLWHSQVNFLEDELSFPSPAIFLQYTMLSTRDMGDLTQEVTWQVDVRLFYETMADTSRGSMNRVSAVAFLQLLTKIHQTFHGASGDNFSSMRRTGLLAEDTGSIGNLYKVSFTCISIDRAAAKAYNDGAVAELEVENAKGPETEPIDEPLYDITIGAQSGELEE